MNYIDAETYVGTCHNYGSTVSELIETLADNGVSRALVSSLSAIEQPNQLENAIMVFEKCRPFSDMLFPLLTLAPDYSGWESCWEKLYCSAYAVKLMPRYHRVDFFGQDFDMLASLLAAHDKSLVISLRFFDDRSVDDYVLLLPIDVDVIIEIANRYPGLKLIISGATFGEAETILSANLSNLCVGTSFIEGEYAIEYLVEKWGPGRMIYGSNYPFFYMDSAKVQLKSSNLPSEIKEQIFCRNAEYFFRISS